MMCPDCDKRLNNKHGSASLSAGAMTVRLKLCDNGHEYMTIEYPVQTEGMGLREAVRLLTGGGG